MTAYQTMTDSQTAWLQFLEYVKERTSPTAFGNWIQPISVACATTEAITLRIPNIFFKEYLLSNFKKELTLFLPLTADGDPNITFVIEKQEKKCKIITPTQSSGLREHKEENSKQEDFSSFEVKLNESYRFQTFY